MKMDYICSMKHCWTIILSLMLGIACSCTGSDDKYDHTFKATLLTTDVLPASGAVVQVEVAGDVAFSGTIEKVGGGAEDALPPVYLIFLLEIQPYPKINCIHM